MNVLQQLQRCVCSLTTLVEDLEDRVALLEAGGGVDGNLVDSDDDPAADTDDDLIYAD